MRQIKSRKKQQVIVLSCVFPPEPTVSGRVSQDIAAGLADCGYVVTAVTAYPSRPSGRIPPSFRRRWYSQSDDPAGYHLVRCFSIPSAKSSSFSRLVENLSFGISSASYLLFAPRPSVIYSNTWPVFASGLLSLVAAIRRIPYVVVVQDVYPESYAGQGRCEQMSLSYRVMRWIDGQVARRAAHMIVLSERFARIYREDRQVPDERLSIIPNWAEKSEDQVDPESAPVDGHNLRQRFGIPEEAFLAAYGGNIGVAASVETMVNAFNNLNGNVYGLIAGDGSRLDTCQALAQSNPRVRFFTPWPADQTMALYQAADVLVLPTQGSQSISSVPSKLIHYMLSGRPVIAAGLPGSELADVIEISGCGWLVAPEQPLELAEKIRQVQSLPPAERQRRGAAGRRYAVDNFTSQTCLPKVIGIIERACR